MCRAESATEADAGVEEAIVEEARALEEELAEEIAGTFARKLREDSCVGVEAVAGGALLKIVSLITETVQDSQYGAGHREIRN